MRPRLVAVWGLLVVLAAAIVVAERADLRGRRSRGDSRGYGNPDSRMLLPVPVDQLGAVEVAHAGALHRFERDPSGIWFYHGVHTGSEGEHSHEADPAAAERIERALAAFGRTRIERQFPLRTGDAGDADYGVTRPDTIIMVYRPRDLQPLAAYAVGDVAPDTFSRYVLPVRSSTVATIPNYQIENLLALIAAVTGTSDRGP
jgi:hypothetical protein